MTVIDDVRRLQEAVHQVQEQIEINRLRIERTDEQVNGVRGLSAAIDELAAEVKSLRKAAYWVAGLIVAAAISFAFSVLTLIP